MGAFEIPPFDTATVAAARAAAAKTREGTLTSVAGGGDTVAALKLTFPPEGARLAATGLGVPIKLRGGVPPYTLLADGAVLATGLQRPEFFAPLAGPGFTTLSVIDAKGAAGRVSIELR